MSGDLNLLVEKNLGHQYRKGDATLGMVGFRCLHHKLTYDGREINQLLLDDEVHNIGMELGDGSLVSHSIQVICDGPCTWPS